MDIRPSLPAGAADLYHQWIEHEDRERTLDYQHVVKALGAGFDRGARRYVIRATDAAKYRDALAEAGFIVAVHPLLL